MIGVLRVRDLAVIEELEIELGPGLNVLTGETGSGKSILVRALELVLGARAAPELVRHGAETAVVEALFEAPDGTQRVVRRTVGAGGRSRATVDGELVTIAQLKELARGWVDISSQHEHHTLVDARTHLAWLDRFARHAPALEALERSVERARDALAEHRRFREVVRDRSERMDLLRFQLHEIERVDPKPGELDAVLDELGRLAHADALVRGTSDAAHALHHGDRSAVSFVSRAAAAIGAVLRHDASLQGLSDRLQSARLELEDIADELLAHASRLESDPHRIGELEERERALSRLVRRHGTLDAALAHRAEIQASLDALEDAEAHEAELARAARHALEDAAIRARSLSAARREHAEHLSAAVTAQLAALGMGQARIDVDLSERGEARAEDGLVVDGARLDATGIDRAEFLIAPNPGEPPRPLVRVASGGELSRSLLALKQVLAGLGPVGTYVFDEVDTGVGGAVAEAIGRKLHEVAQHHQVLCITHQAVIAAWADRHLKVAKRVDDGRTRTSVQVLGADGRRDELARMLGGREITAGVRLAASDLLEGARR